MRIKRERTTSPGLDRSTQMLAAFADPVRHRLVNLLSGDRDELCVCHLHGALGLPQPTVSRHLAHLRKAGIVVARKEGLWVHYRLALPKSGLHRTLIGCLGDDLGDPEVFAQDRRRLVAVEAGCENS